MRAPFLKTQSSASLGDWKNHEDIRGRNASYRLTDAFTLRYAPETPSKMNGLIKLKQNHD